MEIPYLDYAKHIEHLVAMGIPKGNIYGNWSKVDTDNLQDKFKCLEQDFSKMIGWTGFL